MIRSIIVTIFMVSMFEYGNRNYLTRSVSSLFPPLLQFEGLMRLLAVGKRILEPLEIMDIFLVRKDAVVRYIIN